MVSATDQPMTRRLKQSMTTAGYNDPSPVRCWVTSATSSRSGDDLVEPPLDQVIGRRRCVIAASAAAQPTPIHALQAGVPHQPLDPAVADAHAVAKDELSVDAAVTVGAVGSCMDLADGL